MHRAPDHRSRGNPVNAWLTALGLLAALCAASNDVRADIYVYTDDSGTPNFTNVPTDARYVLTMRTAEAVSQARYAPANGAGVDRATRRALSPEIRRAALQYHLDPALLHAVIATESGFDAHAVSGKGAMGLMQLMPETARRYGADDPFNPGQNIRAGAQHLSSLLLRFGNNLQLALAAYNSGAANVVKYGGHIPPFAETRAYVPKVMGLYRKYRTAVY